jgi:hypothetical protein
MINKGTHEFVQPVGDARRLRHWYIKKEAALPKAIAVIEAWPNIEFTMYTCIW